MSEDNTNKNVRFEPETGVYHGNSDQISSGNIKERMDFKVETDPVFKRLAEDIYRGKEAGIREPLTNSVTSILRAEYEGYLDSIDEGIIMIRLYDDGESLRLTIRDNGIGMTRDEIREVITRIGSSTSRSDVELTGKFGIGFLATWMIAGGTDGGFCMSSNPRGLDEDPFFGIWDSNGFAETEPYNDTKIELQEDQNGVAFEIFVDNSIDKSDLIDWIDKYAEWTRVPVLFEHHKPDGTVKDEEYQIKSILDKYSAIENGEKEPEDFSYYVPKDSDLTYYTIDKDAFTVVNSNLRGKGNRRSRYNRGIGEKNCILMDVPIDAKWFNSRNFPLATVEIRIHTETPKVVAGPNKGNYVVTGDRNPSELGSNYIGEEQLSSSDVTTPYPTGTRDSLQDPNNFKDWIIEEIHKLYYKDIADIVKRVNNLDDFYNLDDDGISEFRSVCKELSSGGIIKINQVENLANTSFDRDFKRALDVIYNYASVAPEDEKGVSRKENRSNKRVFEIFKDTYKTENRVFMAHRITQERAEFVWESDKDHYVVRIESSSQDIFEDILGWEYLSDLDFESDLDIDDSDRKRYTQNSIDIEDEQITLHIGNYNNTKKIRAEDMKCKIKNQKAIEDNRGNDHNIRKLIIFHRTDDNISDNKEYVGSYVGGVSLKSELYSYFKNTSNVMTLEDVESHADIPVSDGSFIDIIEDNMPDNTVYHIVDEKTIQEFRNESVLESIQNWLRETNGKAPKDCKYIPMTPTELDISGLSLGYRKWCIDTQFDTGGNGYRRLEVDSDVELYSRAVMSEDNDCIKALQMCKANWNNGGKELVELVKNSL